jgi:hypothetical protein
VPISSVGGPGGGKTSSGGNPRLAVGCGMADHDWRCAVYWRLSVVGSWESADHGMGDCRPPACADGGVVWLLGVDEVLEWVPRWQVTGRSLGCSGALHQAAPFRHGLVGLWAWHVLAINVAGSCVDLGL